jgi:peptidoglycan hydrolase-like protein with peptidoglycan-binding domain
MVAGATVVVAGVGWWQWRDAPPERIPAAAPGLASTAIVRTDIIVREQIPGTLGYAAPWQLMHPGPPGVLTAAAPPGSTVRRGQMVYEMDGVPVMLLHGSRPVWREFASGMSPGEDVRQLEENLAALGFRGMTVDGRFTAATKAAIGAWQRRQGRQATGRLPVGSVVFAPGDARVLQPLVPLGSHIAAEPVLRIASTTRGVTAELPLARVTRVRVGGEVEVALPGGARVLGTVTAIGALASEPNAGATAIPMIVALKDPAVAGDPDQVPVQVVIAVAERRGVLAVPVTALVAASTGGYQLIVVDGEARHAIAVQPGLIDERAALVEISGPGLVEGMLVEVPSS